MGWNSPPPATKILRKRRRNSSAVHPTLAGRHQCDHVNVIICSDNLEADIVGANLYRRFISGGTVPEPRRVASDDILLPQNVRRVESVLVSTGVHSSTVHSQSCHTDDIIDNAPSHCHRDFADVTPDLLAPTVSVENVKHAVEYILQRERDAASWIFTKIYDSGPLDYDTSHSLLYEYVWEHEWFWPVFMNIRITLVNWLCRMNIHDAWLVFYPCYDDRPFFLIHMCIN